MKVYVDLGGTGIGAQRQFKLLRPELERKGVRFVGNPWSAEVVLYWNAHTRDLDRLKRLAEQKRVVARVGGWHPETAEVTRRVLAEVAGAFFVSEADKEFAKRLGWKLPPYRTVIRNASIWRGARRSSKPHLLIRHANIGMTYGRKRLDRSYSLVSLASVWGRVRKHYPQLEVKVLGTVDGKLKRKFSLSGWKWVGKVSPREAVNYGRQAWALVHMVVSDHAPNSVAEAIGEGCPVIVPDIGGAAELAGSGGFHVPMHEAHKGTWDVFGERFVIGDDDAMFQAIAWMVEWPGYWAGEVWRWHRTQLQPSVVAGRMWRFLRGEKFDD